MSESVLQLLQAIVRRHRHLFLTGAVIPCAGCFSCTGLPSRVVIHDITVQLDDTQRAALAEYAAPMTAIPFARCTELCKAESARTSRMFHGCQLPPNEYALVCASPTQVVPVSLRELPAGPPSAELCQQHCGPLEPGTSCRWAAPQQLVCNYRSIEVMAAGRRPPGLEEAAAAAVTPLAGWLAESARLEAAAVIAFCRLHEELCLLDAPRALRDSCLLAIDEERHHAELLSGLARAAGCVPSPPQVLPEPPRSLLALAYDNAVEGCVRESFGALEALWQSHAAARPEVRAAMAIIAEDEARHAELALTIDKWLKNQLTDAQQSDVRSAQRAAYQKLLHDIEKAPPVPELGLLRGPLARALLQESMPVLVAELMETRI